MSDTWTLGKRLEDVEHDLKILKEVAHAPIFTEEMINKIFEKLASLEKKIEKCSCGNKQVKAKA